MYLHKVTNTPQQGGIGQIRTKASIEPHVKTVWLQGLESETGRNSLVKNSLDS